jgi:hypothetical protein
MTTDVVSRLAAANPVPAGPRPDPRPFRLRRVAVALAVLAVIGVPTAAFAGDIGNLLGFTNQGTSLPTSSTPMAQLTGLAQAMQSMNVPSTMHLLGTLDGISFYAARKADGNFCFAISSDHGKGFGCTLDDDFPSAARPVLLFPTPVGAQIAGFAVDGVASVALLDASGAPVARATVGDNIFVGDVRPDGAVTIEALDANGNVIATRPLPG